MSRDDDVQVLIAGGGVAALEAALALRELAEDRVSVELLAPEPHFWYRALAVAEPFALGEVRRFELAELAARAGATFTLGSLLSVDAARGIAYTKPGGAVEYSRLLIACGAAPEPAVEGAITFRGPADTEKIAALLAELEAGAARRVAFAVPAGAVWSLPVYELALMTAGWLAAKGVADVALAIVTPEEEPLHLFGRDASAAVCRLLEERDVSVHTHAYPVRAREGELLLIGSDIIPADRVVALPRLQGLRIGGVPQNFEGFVPVDANGRVTGMPGVFAAGDITTFPVKQGGLAAQQADAAAEAIAAEVGVALEPRPFRPVLRGVLLTGDGPRYLRGDLGAGSEASSEASMEPLWWPPAKIVGRYLAPFLADQSRVDAAGESPPDGVSVDVELDPKATVQRRDRLIEAAVEDALRDRTLATVGEIMSPDVLVFAPEDTLGEIAERMSELDFGSALVAEYGRLIGILTSRDMLRALAGRVHPSDARARQWMTADPIVVTERTSLETARLLMTEHGIHHLPVVEGERPVGMVGLREVVRDLSPIQVGLGF
jgi:sulfide:quinone oxidoreductase